MTIKDHTLEAVIDALEYRVAKLEDLVHDNFEQIEKMLLLSQGLSVRPKVDSENQRRALRHRREVYYKVMNRATTDA